MQFVLLGADIGNGGLSARSQSHCAIQTERASALWSSANIVPLNDEANLAQIQAYFVLVMRRGVGNSGAERG